MRKTGANPSFEAVLSIANERNKRLGAIKTALQNDDATLALSLMRRFFGLKETTNDKKKGYSAS